MFTGIFYAKFGLEYPNVFNLIDDMNENLPNGEKLIAEPIPPEDWECCENACEEMCVYEIYRVQKQAYDEQQKRLAKMLEPID